MSDIPEGVIKGWNIKRSGKGLVVIYSGGKLTGVTDVYVANDGTVVALTTDKKLHVLSAG